MYMHGAHMLYVCWGEHCCLLYRQWSSIGVGVGCAVLIIIFMISLNRGETSSIKIQGGGQPHNKCSENQFIREVGWG